MTRMMGHSTLSVLLFSLASTVESVAPVGGLGGLARLGATGALLGPAVDAVHNQALLVYDKLPLSVSLPLGTVQTSLLVPPLLFVAYAVLGGVLPTFSANLLPSHEPELPPAGGSPATRGLLAVSSTVCIIKLSEVLVSATTLPSGAVLAALTAMCLMQWKLLDGRISSLVLAAVAAVGGPLAELPLMKLGCWHYISPDYWPLAAFGFGPEVPGAEWAGLSLITGPCYACVTTDAIALGRWYAWSGSADVNGPSSPAITTVDSLNGSTRSDSPTAAPSDARTGRTPRMSLTCEVREPLVTVKPSEAKGLGAFAAQRIPRGAFVCTYRGELLSKNEAASRYYDRDAHYLFRLSDDCFVDASASDHFSKRINHARHGTLDAVKDGDEIVFFASRDLEFGEELTFDYGEEFWIAAAHWPAPDTDDRAYLLRRMCSPHTVRRASRVIGPLWSNLVLPLTLPAAVCTLMLW